MFIKCSSCNSKYLINSADIKPNGRMVECGICSHQWYQDPLIEESSIPPSSQIQDSNKHEDNLTKKDNTNETEKIKNLPSTIVKEAKPSIINSFLIIIILILIILFFLLFRSYGANIFVLFNYFINEFYFNLKLIFNDIAKIIYQIVNQIKSN